MPAKNIIRIDLPHSYYHVYSRGVNKQIIFHDNTDKDVFMKLVARYLSKEPIQKVWGGIYDSFRSDIDICSFVLMDNHFHFLIYQTNSGQLAEFMRCILNSYVRYFNERHGRVGPLFQSKYKASLIDEESYWLYISRYIHRNPKKYDDYKYSSYQYYTNRTTSKPGWLKTSHVIDAFGSRSEYITFVSSDEIQEVRPAGRTS